MDLSAIATPALTGALTNILLAVFTILLTLVIRVTLAFVKSRTTASQFRMLSNIAHEAVTTAEQLALANNINVNAKKQYAEGLVAHAVDQYGLDVTPTQIDTAIESAVYTSFNWDKQVASAAAPTAAPAS